MPTITEQAKKQLLHESIVYITLEGKFVKTPSEGAVLAIGLTKNLELGLVDSTRLIEKQTPEHWEYTEILFSIAEEEPALDYGDLGELSKVLRKAEENLSKMRKDAQPARLKDAFITALADISEQAKARRVFISVASESEKTFYSEDILYVQKNGKITKKPTGELILAIGLMEEGTGEDAKVHIGLLGENGLISMARPSSWGAFQVGLDSPEIKANPSSHEQMEEVFKLVKDAKKRVFAGGDAFVEAFFERAKDLSELAVEIEWAGFEKRAEYYIRRFHSSKDEGQRKEATKTLAQIWIQKQEDLKHLLMDDTYDEEERFASVSQELDTLKRVQIVMADVIKSNSEEAMALIAEVEKTFDIIREWLNEREATLKPTRHQDKVKTIKDGSDISVPDEKEEISKASLSSTSSSPVTVRPLHLPEVEKEYAMPTKFVAPLREVKNGNPEPLKDLLDDDLSVMRSRKTKALEGKVKRKVDFLEQAVDQFEIALALITKELGDYDQWPMQVQEKMRALKEEIQSFDLSRLTPKTQAYQRKIKILSGHQEQLRSSWVAYTSATAFVEPLGDAKLGNSRPLEALLSHDLSVMQLRKNKALKEKVRGKVDFLEQALEQFETTSALIEEKLGNYAQWPREVQKAMRALKEEIQNFDLSKLAPKTADYKKKKSALLVRQKALKSIWTPSKPSKKQAVAKTTKSPKKIALNKNGRAVSPSYVVFDFSKDSFIVSIKCEKYYGPKLKNVKSYEVFAKCLTEVFPERNKRTQALKSLPESMRLEIEAADKKLAEGVGQTWTDTNTRIEKGDPRAPAKAFTARQGPGTRSKSVVTLPVGKKKEKKAKKNP